MIVKQQADVRSRINFDRVSSYATQCNALKNNGCYCDPPVTIESSAPDESLALSSYSDGIYLELTDAYAKTLQRKKLSDKLFCAYTYSSANKQWSSQQQKSHTFLKSGERFILYKLADGSLCRLEGFTTTFGSELAPAVFSRLHSCSADSPTQTTFYLQQRYPSNLITTSDYQQHALLGQEFMNSLQQYFSPNGNLFVSRFRPYTKQSGGYDGVYGSDEDYSRMEDDTEIIFSQVASHVQHAYKNNFILLSPMLSLASYSIGKDQIILTYYGGSPKSKLLAEVLEKRLRQLNGHSYKDGVILSDVDPEYSSFLFSFEILQLPEQDSLYALGDPRFTSGAKCKDISALWVYCQERGVKKISPQFYEQRSEIPALSITFVDAQNSHSLYDHRIPLLAQTLFLGVQDYLQQQATSQTSPLPQNLFSPP
ncbi:MAG TPA: hypothetical protein VJH37_00050 [Candidatus Nanoarchaeia archaeon]|nr:hypothetical protein [Candidatus Nanoarchaeia archaeon]